MLLCVAGCAVLGDMREFVFSFKESWTFEDEGDSFDRNVGDYSESDIESDFRIPNSKSKIVDAL
jgi:hypothetical protein